MFTTAFTQVMAKSIGKIYIFHLLSILHELRVVSIVNNTFITNVTQLMCEIDRKNYMSFTFDFVRRSDKLPCKKK